MNGNNDNKEVMEKMSLETPTTSQMSPDYPSTPDTPERRDVNGIRNTSITDLDLDLHLSDIPYDEDSLDRTFIQDSDSDLDTSEKEKADLDSPVLAILPRGPNGHLAAPASPRKVTQLPEHRRIPEPSNVDFDDPILSQEDENWEQGLEPDYAQAMGENKHRWWKITWFPPWYEANPSKDAITDFVYMMKKAMENFLLLANIICCIIGMEICPKTGRLHAHILLGFKDSVRYNTIKKILLCSQIRHLLTDQAIVFWYDYVVKAFSKIDHPDRVMMWGADEVAKRRAKVQRSQKRTHREMFFDNQRAIEEGRFDDIDPLFRFDHMNKINQWYVTHHQPAAPLDYDRLVFIWGRPGVGKTSLFTRNMDPRLIYWKNPEVKWWLGYKDQPIVIIDEIVPQTFKARHINWNLLGDRTEIFVEIKGGQVLLKAKWVIVISNYSLDELCSYPRKGLDVTMKDTFKRRCGNDVDGYRIYKFPSEPRADNGNRIEVSRRVKTIWKGWYSYIQPYFRDLLPENRIEDHIDTE